MLVFLWLRRFFLGVFVCVSAVRRIVAPLAADEPLCFKSRLPSECRETITAQIGSLIHIVRSHYSPAIAVPFLATSNSAFYLAGKNTDLKAK